MKASDYIIQFLQAQGVAQVFEMSGGMITHLLDSCHRAQMKVISIHHEQAAAFAADAVGRMTGIPGVAMATSGPGATNLLTGIGSCYFDSSPAIFITGQVNRHEQKGDRPIRQLGFQETDIVAMAAPITKAAWRVNDPERLPQMLADAFRLATSGRPGPVLLDVPMDVQRIEIEGPLARITVEPAPAPRDRAAYLESLLTAVAAARRPLILAGGGIRSALAAEPMRQFVQQLGIPVVHSLMGVDLLPYADPLRIGMIGSYGNRWANHALGTADLILVLGSRLDVRQTGADTTDFRANKTIFHVDCEPGELNNRVTGCRILPDELLPFLQFATQFMAGRAQASCAAWIAEIAALRAKWPDTGELTGGIGINPNQLMHQISQHCRTAAAYVIDVGQHQMWAAQSLELAPHQRFLTSGGMGSMGFALPAALGAAAAAPGSPVVVVAGDGGFQSNIQELQTVVRNHWPIKTIILNNLCHGMVRQFQQSYFHERYQSTLWGYTAPDFARVAEAYGMPAKTVEQEAGIAGALAWLWSDPAQPALLQVMIDKFTNVYPKMAFGKPITEMEPFSKPLEMEGT